MNRAQTRQLKAMYKRQGVSIMPGSKAELKLAEKYVAECVREHKNFSEDEFIKRLKNAI